MAQNNLGVAYQNLPAGERGENLRLAIVAYESALEVRTRDAFPRDHEQTRGNLERARGWLAEFEAEG